MLLTPPHPTQPGMGTAGWGMGRVSSMWGAAALGLSLQAGRLRDGAWWACQVEFCSPLRVEGTLQVSLQSQAVNRKPESSKSKAREN